ncbi:hypothetical protein GCM10010160_75680 [Acrocarpospora corrugata]
MRLTVAAPDLSRLPSGRSAESYGRDPQDWNPFSEPKGQRPLVAYAREQAVLHGFLAEVGPLGGHMDQLTRDDGPDAPGVIVVDPWAVRDAELRESLRRVCRLASRPLPIVVWNMKDEQTARAETELRALLREAIPERPGVPVAAHITSLAAFDRDLPRIFTTALTIYSRSNRLRPEYPLARPRLTAEQDD